MLSGGKLTTLPTSNRFLDTAANPSCIQSKAEVLVLEKKLLSLINSTNTLLNRLLLDSRQSHKKEFKQRKQQRKQSKMMGCF